MNQKEKDILTIFHYGKEVGWLELYNRTLDRILYFCAATFNFLYEDENPFTQEYKFQRRIPDIKADIEKNIQSLIDKNMIKETEEGRYILLTNGIEIEDTQRNNMIREIVHNIAIYGQEHLYGFLVFDPICYKMKTSKTNKIDFNENDTLFSINEFNEVLLKTVFQNNTEVNVKKERILRLYFEFIYSLIIKGENPDKVIEFIEV